jgi:hypothetical protein
MFDVGVEVQPLSGVRVDDSECVMYTKKKRIRISSSDRAKLLILILMLMLNQDY